MVVHIRVSLLLPEISHVFRHRCTGSWYFCSYHWGLAVKTVPHCLVSKGGTPHGNSTHLDGQEHQENYEAHQHRIHNGSCSMMTPLLHNETNCRSLYTPITCATNQISIGSSTPHSKYIHSPSIFLSFFLSLNYTSFNVRLEYNNTIFIPTPFYYRRSRVGSR